MNSHVMWITISVNELHIKKKKKSEDRDPILIFSGKEKVVQSQPREGSKF